MTTALQVRDLRKEFKTPHGTVTALAGVTLDFYAGEVAAIAGPSGSGKTTLLSVLGGLESATSGDILIEGQDRKGRFGDLTDYRLRHVGFVFQSGNLLPHLTALENVMAPMQLAGARGGDIRTRAIALLESVGIGRDRFDHRPSRLSGGQQQRVAFARAMGNQPRLILADEPTGNLDQQNGRQLFHLLEALTVEHGVCAILVTHDMGIAGMAARVIEMRDGLVAADRRRKPLPVASPAEAPVGAPA
jgi:putative ABC transport system ATP-binding protein